MKTKSNLLKVILMVFVVFLFLILLKETSKIGKVEKVEFNETNKTLTNVTEVSRAMSEITSNASNIINNITNNITTTVTNETKIKQGETKRFNMNNKIVNVTLNFVVREYAIFIVNGEKTDKLSTGDTYTTKQGITIAVLDIWVQDFEGGKREVDFLLG